MQRVATSLIVVLMTTPLIGGCGDTSNNDQASTSDDSLSKEKPSLDLESRYKWIESSAPGGMTADGITLKETIKNGERMVAYGTAEGGAGKMPFVGSSVIVDTPGSRDIHIEIDPEAKSTTYAGLTFTEPCVVEIRDDGTLLADKQGLTAKDKDEKEWVSQNVKLDDQDVFAFFPSK